MPIVELCFPSAEPPPTEAENKIATGNPRQVKRTISLICTKNTATLKVAVYKSGGARFGKKKGIFK